MSSGISTDARPAPTAGARRSSGAEGLRPWQFFAVASLLAATAAVWIGRPAGLAALVLLSAAIGAGGCAAVALYRTVWPLVAPEFSDGIAMVGAHTRAALEREKTAVLRAIKELEFDRAMGKVSNSDFEELMARLRGRALALLRQLEQEGSPYRELIERELRVRLAARLAAAAAREAEGGERPGRSLERAEAADGVGHPLGEGLPLCGACGTANDADARFCKHCGARLAGSA
jgi:hypothetical protein